MILELRELAPGAKVGLRLTNSTSSRVREFTVQAPGGEQPQPRAFTAELGAGDLGASPMKQVFHGTGTPGSTVVAESAYGRAEVTVGGEGYWELRLKMYEVPAGTEVIVHVVSSQSEQVYEFGLQRPGVAPTYEFTANAAFTECNATPPFNEYWGTATPGAVISISSAYASKQVVANGDGNWAARIEFPEAPVGQVFAVAITSSLNGNGFELSFVRTAPV